MNETKAHPFCTNTVTTNVSVLHVDLLLYADRGARRQCNLNLFITCTARLALFVVVYL